MPADLLNSPLFLAAAALSVLGALLVLAGLVAFFRLRLLSFEVESGTFGCYRPAMRTEKWLDRYDWMDMAGERWWPIFGAVYFLIAVKKVRGIKLIGPAWKAKPAIAAAPVPVANRGHPIYLDTHRKKERQ